MIQTNNIYWADKLGAISAFLCIIHCLTVPTLLAFGMGFLSNPIVSVLFVVIAFISVYNTTKGNFTNGISVYLWLAFFGFVISMLLEEHGAFFEYAMFAFSILIIAGHLYKMRPILK